MKKLLGLGLLMLILVAAVSPATKSTKPEKMSSIEGTWELVSHYNYDDNEITDTIFASENYRQIKMYYNGKVMWTKYQPADSVEWFGYGAYKTTEDRLKETLEFGSASIMEMMGDNFIFEHELIIDDRIYSQISLDEDENRMFSENYKRID